MFTNDPLLRKMLDTRGAIDGICTIEKKYESTKLRVMFVNVVFPETIDLQYLAHQKLYVFDQKKQFKFIIYLKSYNALADDYVNFCGFIMTNENNETEEFVEKLRVSSVLSEYNKMPMNIDNNFYDIYLYV